MENSHGVAIVTGASKGVGFQTTLALVRRGWHVIMNARGQEALEEAAQQCSQEAGTVATVVGDIADDRIAKSLADTAAQSIGRVDLVVNNAGTTTFCNHDNLAGLSAADFDRIYQVNVVGPFQLIRACQALLRCSQSPSVINIASIAGVTGIGSSVAYAASKGALITMTKSLARALGPIRVNAICPGFIEGEWLQQGLGQDRYDAIRNTLRTQTPLKRVTTPKDVAAAVVALGVDTPLITGEAVILDAGASLGPVPKMGN